MLIAAEPYYSTIDLPNFTMAVIHLSKTDINKIYGQEGMYIN